MTVRECIGFQVDRRKSVRVLDVRVKKRETSRQEPNLLHARGALRTVNRRAQAPASWRSTKFEFVIVGQDYL